MNIWEIGVIAEAVALCIVFGMVIGYKMALKRKKPSQSLDLPKDLPIRKRK